MKRKTLVTLLVVMVVSLCMAFSTMGVSAKTLTEDWQSNNDKGTAVRTENGIELGTKEATAGIIFDYTYVNTVNLAELKIGTRFILDTTQAGGHARVNYYFTKTLEAGKNPVAEAGSIWIQLIKFAEDAKIGVVLSQSNGTEYAAKDAWAPWSKPNFMPSLSDNKTLNLSMTKEGDNWFLFCNRSRLTLNSDFSGFLNQDKYPAYMTINAHDQDQGQASLGMTLAISQINDRVFGDLNEIVSLTNTDKGNVNKDTSTYVSHESDMTISGDFTANSALMAFKYGFSAETKLDGFSFNVDLSGMKGIGTNAKYIDFILTNTGLNSNRIDPWDSTGDAVAQPNILAYSLRMPLAGGGLIHIVKGQELADPTKGYFDVYDAANNVTVEPHYEFSGFIRSITDQYTLTFVKIGADWKVLLNGSGIGIKQEKTDQFNALMNGMASGNFYPGLAIGTNGTTEPATRDDVKLLGLGGRMIGKEIDPNEGVMGDDINGKFEFVKTQWTSFAPSDATVTYDINENGFNMFGINRVSGFSMGMRNTVNIESLDDYAITIKLPDTVFPGGANLDAGYGLFLGDSLGNKNFYEQKSIYLRLEFKTTNPSDGGSVLLTTRDNNVVPLTEAVGTFEGKPTVGKEKEVTIRFKKDVKGGTRIYINGKRVTSPAFETALTPFAAGMESKYVYAMASNAKQVGNAWVGNWEEGENTKTGFTLVSIGGKKIVNEIAEPVNVDAPLVTNTTANSITLSFKKAAYPLGDMDSFNFAPDGYIVERCKGNNPIPEKTFKIDDINTLTFTDTGLDAGTSYYYTIHAVSGIASAEPVTLLTYSGKTQKTLEAPKPETGCGGGAASILLTLVLAAVVAVRKFW